MDKVLELLKQKDCTFPRILLTSYRKLNITDLELIVLIYLINCDNMTYNPTEISKDLNIKTNDILEIINNLTEKGIINLEVVKINKISSEIINLDLLYEKLAYIAIGKEFDDKKNNSFIEKFEEELGRSLTSTECELINGWVDLEYSDEIILCALNEAIFYTGGANFRYIDKILYEWHNKGLKTKEDVEKNKKEFKKAKSRDSKISDDYYDWLNDK